jgi:hypothetical protein
VINVDSRLFDLIPALGSDAFTVLMIIAKHSNTKKQCFPSVETIQKGTGLGRNKVFQCLKVLKEHSLIEAEQRHKNGRLTTSLYQIKSRYLSAYSKSVSSIQCHLNQYTENEDTEIQDTDFGTEKLLINSSEIINQSLEVINQSPEIIPQKKKSGKVAKSKRNYQYTEEFEEAWCLYGRRGDKKASNDEFELAKKREPHLMEKLRSSIPRYLRTRRVLDGYKRDFERFLKGDMFDSEWQVDFAENVEELQEKYEQNESLSNTLNFLAESKRVQRLQDAMRRGEIQRVA